MVNARKFGVLCCAALLGVVSCGDPESNTYARRVESVGELIEVQGAIGEVGDYLIGNQKIRVILQNQGWSRGFGIFGGGIIDADIVRPGTQGDFGRGNGKDNFGEFFPALFLQAFDVASRRQRDENGELVELPAIEVLNDGTDGEPALIRTRARAGDFITLASIIGEEITKDATAVVFETDYLIKPGARHIEITGRLTNRGSSAAKLDGEGLAGLLSTIGGSTIESLPIPLGDVLLFGSGNNPFAPGGITDPFGDGEEVRAAGYDLRFAVEDAYTLGVSLPSLPGLVTDFLASSGEDVSYGFAIGETESNYPYSNRDLFAVDPKIGSRSPRSWYPSSSAHLRVRIIRQRQRRLRPKRPLNGPNILSSVMVRFSRFSTSLIRSAAFKPVSSGQRSKTSSPVTRWLGRIS